MLAFYLDLMETYAIIQWAFGIVAGFFIVLSILLILRALAHRSYRTAAAFQMRVFLVTVPKEAAKDKQQEDRGPVSLESIREKIAVVETFLSSIGGLRAERGFKAWFFGREDHLAFEIVAERDMISFYVAMPERMQSYIDQQIHAQYPEAQIDVVTDYNIFVPTGTTVADMLIMHRQFLFPLKTYRKIEADPLNALTNILSKLDASEGAAIQYVVRSAKGVWHSYGRRVAAEMQQGKRVKEALGKVFASPLAGLFKVFHKAADAARTTEQPKKDENSYRLSPLEEEMVKGIEEKTSKAGLDVNVRIVVSSKDPSRAKEHLQNIVNAFTQYNLYEYGNSVKPIHPRRIDWIIRDFIYRHFDEKHTMLLNTEEFASVFHFPLPTTETPNIRWLMAKKAAPPPNVPHEGLILGKCVYRGEETSIRIKREDRRRHVYIIGKSGVGKSWLLANMAKQDVQNGEGVCIIDPHGDFAEDVLSCVPKERAEDLVYFDPSDLERPMGLNMLEVEREEQKDFAVQEMISIFYKLFPPEMIGPMFEHNMRNVMLTLMADPEEQGTVAEIPRMFSDAEYQQYWVAKVKDPVVRAFWEKEMAKTSDFHKSEMLGYLISKVGRFVENEMMRNIIGQVHSGFNFREVMDKKKILIVNLAKGKTGEVNSNLLGLIIVSKLQMAAMTRAELPEAQRHDFYLYIDEFQNFITPSIATILSEARKYRLNLIIAHQYMGQLVQEGGKTETRDAVLGNAGTMLAFRIGVEDAEVLAKEYAPIFNAYDLVNVEKFTAYTKLLIDNTAARPFNMETFPFKRGDPVLMGKIRQLSRLKYARDRRVVEAEILERSRLGGDETDLPTVDRTM